VKADRPFARTSAPGDDIGIEPRGSSAGVRVCDGASSDNVVRRVVITTVISIFVSVAFTLIIIYAVAGVDFTATLSVAQFWRIGMTISVVAPLAVCPLLTFQRARAMRNLSRVRDELVIATQSDPLTGLLNRRGFDTAAARLFAKSSVFDEPISALMCDIDMFKSINDKYGHEFGDLALIRVADIIRDSVGDLAAVLGRQGGEEFAILLPGVDAENAVAIAEELRSACAAHAFPWETAQVRITLSIGCATDRADQVDARTLLGRADAALYQAKRDGRNRVIPAPARPGHVKLIHPRSAKVASRAI